MAYSRPGFRARMLGIAVVLGPTLTMTSCRASLVAVDQPWGIVEATSMAEAKRLAAAVKMAREAVVGFNGFEDRPLKIRFVDRISVLSEAQGYTQADEIQVRRDLYGRKLEGVLAHELVHGLVGPAYEELPVVMSEGLADLARVDPPSLINEAIYLPLVVDRRSANLSSLVQFVSPADLPSVEECLTSSASEYIGASIVRRSVMSGVGALLARRLGQRGLLELCERARADGLDLVPASWILEAADLDRTRSSSWFRLIGDFKATHSQSSERGREQRALVREDPRRPTTRLPHLIP